RQRHSNEPVQSELFQGTSMQHGRRRRRRSVPEGRPGVERPERNQDAESEQEHRKDQLLFPAGQRMIPHVLRYFGNIEAAGLRLQVKGDQTGQGNKRPNAQVESDLKGRVILSLAAPPDSNHQEGWDQRQFMKQVKEKQVQGGERAQDARRHDQQQNVKLLLPV